MFNVIRHAVTVGFLAQLLCPLATPQSQAEELTLERIMAHPDWIGRSPESAYWGQDGRSLYFKRKREGQEIRDLYRLELKAERPTKIDGPKLGHADGKAADYTQERSKAVYVKAGDLFVVDRERDKRRQLTRTDANEANPRFALDGKAVAYTVNGRYRVRKLGTGLTYEPARILAKDDPGNEESDFDFYERRQERLFESVRQQQEDQQRRRKHEESLRRAVPTRGPKRFYLGSDVKIVTRSLSPSSKHMLVVTRPDSAKTGRKGTMPKYVTHSGYVETKAVRTRVGHQPPIGQTLWLIDIQRHTKHKLDISGLPQIREDPLKAIRAKAVDWHVQHGADRDAVEKELKAPDVRPVQFAGIRWSDDGHRVAVQIHAIDNKDRWLTTVDLKDRQLNCHHRLHDDAWINWRHNEFGWLPQQHTLWYLSEETGYSHLYVKPLQGEARALTHGDYVVGKPKISPDGNYIYFVANRPNPGIYEVYRVPITGGKVERMTDMDGYVESFALSPEGKRLLVRHSKALRPPELFVKPNQTQATSRRLTHTVSEAFRSIDWNAAETVQVPSSHVKRPIRANLYKPNDFDPAKEYPAVVFIHGAGYLQNSVERWSHYFREMMFHTLLTREGYIVLDMDYRGSAGYGRDWRTAIYRRMGHPEVEDLVDGVHYLIDEHNVDTRRVGTYGGSYGGFLTFMAMFRKPELFAAGAALRPVSDWSSYAHSYTSNILNTPRVDPMAYQRSSPIDLADGLEKPLLICHGMKDSNVFFQDTVRLVQRLIELEKSHFETAIYPQEGHTFQHPESWLDEYRRIHRLFRQKLQ